MPPSKFKELMLDEGEKSSVIINGIPDFCAGERVSAELLNA
jgi:hypothetical protein